MTNLLKVYSTNEKIQGVIDITVNAKGLFSPSMTIAQKLVSKEITEEQFSDSYIAELRKSYSEHKADWIKIIGRDSIVLYTKTPMTRFNHAWLLIDTLLKVSKHENKEAAYFGEYNIKYVVTHQDPKAPEVKAPVAPPVKEPEKAPETKEPVAPPTDNTGFMAGIPDIDDGDIDTVNERIIVEDDKLTDELDDDTMYIYTDGACRGNGQSDNLGARAFIIRFTANGQTYEDSCTSVEENTTNNIQEVMAVIDGVYNAKEIAKAPDGTMAFDNFVIYSDSQYVCNAFNQGWLERWQKNGWKTSGKKPVQNKELWLELIEELKDIKYKFIKVPGHATNVYNNKCDAMCNEAMDKYSK